MTTLERMEIKNVVEKYKRSDSKNRLHSHR